MVSVSLMYVCVITLHSILSETYVASPMEWHQVRGM
jgi:hypothetical protein